MKPRRQVAPRIALVACASLFAGAASAQAPSYISQWGTPGSGIGQFNDARWLTLDAAGNVYVVDYGNDRIQVFDANGGYLMQLGGHGSGNGQFIYPSAVTVDGGGFIYVSDYGNNRIQKFTSAGVYVTQWSKGLSPSDHIQNPHDVAIDASGDVLVLDEMGPIWRFLPDGTCIDAWYGNGFGHGPGQFWSSGGIAVGPDGKVYATDYVNNNVKIFTSGGAFLTEWGTAGSGDGQFANPVGLWVTSDNKVYVADPHNNRIQVFSTSGGYQFQWGTAGSGSGQFNVPDDVAVAATGYVYVMDSVNSRVQKFGPAATPAVVTSWARLKTLYR